ACGAARHQSLESAKALCELRVAQASWRGAPLNQDHSGASLSIARRAA
ncbi:hypothetical protein A2U01_0076710, partial [Trifolium medium]|nr:hypothetical protein [Trifolium medium]